MSVLKRMLEARKSKKTNKINKDQLHKKLFFHYPDALFLLDVNGNFKEVNHGLEELTGYSKEELLHSHFSQYIYDDDLENVMEYLKETLEGKVEKWEFRIVDKSKRIKFISISVVSADIEGEFSGVYGRAKDITERKQLELALNNSEIRFESLIQNSSDVIGILDKDGKIRYQSQAVKQILGFEPDQLIGNSCFEYIFQDDLEIVNDLFSTALDTPSVTVTAEFRLKKANGEWIYCEANLKNLLNDQNVNGIVVNYRDISVRKKYEQEIQHIAFHDHLTGLPNRKLLENVLLKEITNNNNMALLFIDLDRFKVINDSMGYSVGDLLLQKVTERLKSSIAEKDMLVRQGGDEFIIFLANADRRTASDVSEKIVEALSSPFTINNYDMLTTPSIGISLFPEDGNTVEQLIKHADYAMNQAKKNGKNTYHFYSTSKHNQQINPLKMEMELRKAIERNELMLYYQPKMNLKTGAVVGVEALIRWSHPELGLVSPGSFIPLAEETGLIIPIGKWALHTACIQNKKWQEQGFSPMVVSVNLSVRQFSQSNLVQTVAETIIETGLDPQYLELEVTESMTANIDYTIKTLQQLKDLGVRISIDDFGTGFSSLNYLKEFPVDTLKIDQSFVRELQNNPNDQTIVKTIISMAHNLNLSVVAEGIETREQLVFLQEHLCNEGQGYFFSKPIPAKELSESFTKLDQIINMHDHPQVQNERLWGGESVRIPRQQSEMALREREEKYRLIAENVTDLISILDTNGKFVYASPSYRHVLGSEPKLLETSSYFKIVHPDDAALFITQYNQMLISKESFNGEYRLKHADGTWIIAEADLTPITNENGDVEQIVVAARNVTEKRQAEDLLWKFEKLSMVGQLAAGVAHEIRNPLTSIKGFVQLFQQGIIKEEYFHVMMEEFKQLDRIIDDFLTLAKPQAHQFIKSDPQTLLESVKKMMKPEADLQNIQIEIECEKNLPSITCEPNQIRQVFIKLVKNSIEAMPNGGVVKIKAIKEKSSLVLNVIDEGIGLSQDRIERLGEPFYSNKEKGTGLGLMVSYRIIRDHNGTISIKSEKDKGTTVEVTLPII